MIIRYSTILLIAAAFLAGEAIAQQEVTLTPVKDNSIYEESDASNGAGEYLFAGRTGTNHGPYNRRALLAFDVAGDLAEDVQVDSVRLTIYVSMVPVFATTPHEFTLHRLTSDWGEEASDAGTPGGQGGGAETGDATWNYAFYDTDEWENQGGDFESAESAVFTVGTSQDTYTVSSTDALVADVQMWHDDPDSNFGWIIIGDESQMHTARRFNSRENATSERRPQLTIYYTESTASERDDLPQTLVLEGNYPNPFEQSTTIRYEVEKPQEVRIDVVDLTGRAVLEIDRGIQVAGPQTFQLSADGLAAGMYMYCVSGNESGRDCRSMVVLP